MESEDEKNRVAADSGFFSVKKRKGPFILFSFSFFVFREISLLMRESKETLRVPFLGATKIFYFFVFFFEKSKRGERLKRDVENALSLS